MPTDVIQNNSLFQDSAEMFLVSEPNGADGNVLVNMLLHSYEVKFSTAHLNELV